MATLARNEDTCGGLGTAEPSALDAARFLSVKKRVRVIDELERVRPDLEDALTAIGEGRVLVDGRPVTNPGSRIPRGAAVVVREPVALRGSVKLRSALDAFGVDVSGRVALDVGAAAGGFVVVLLERGARRVYAVDAGHGQLLGSLRQDPRVVNLERTNVAELTREVVPEAVEVVTVDVSYLSLADAVAQLDRVELAPGAQLIGLVKPMFELRLDRAPSERGSLDRALELARGGVEAAGWTVRGTMDSPVTGAKGTPELFIWARRAP